MSGNLDVLTRLSPAAKQSLTVSAVALLAGAGIAFFALRPTHRHLQSARAELAQSNEIFARMEKDIAGAPKQRETTEASEAEREALVSAGVLEPLLGSYAMRGKSLLDPLAKQTGFTLDNVKEARFIPLQVPQKTARQLYGRQMVEFTGHGSFTQIAGFIQAAEAEFPLAILSELKIEAQNQKPESHKATVSFEWPVRGEKQP